MIVDAILVTVDAILVMIVGCNSGHDSGCNIGDDSGCNIGHESGCNIGHDSGYNIGDDSGCNIGDDSGCNVGHDSGCNIGDDKGCNIGHDSLLHKVGTREFKPPKTLSPWKSWPVIIKMSTCHQENLNRS